MMTCLPARSEAEVGGEERRGEGKGGRSWLGRRSKVSVRKEQEKVEREGGKGRMVADKKSK